MSRVPSTLFENHCTRSVRITWWKSMYFMAWTMGLDKKSPLLVYLLQSKLQGTHWPGCKTFSGYKQCLIPITTLLKEFIKCSSCSLHIFWPWALKGATSWLICNSNLCHLQLSWRKAHSRSCSLLIFCDSNQAESLPQWCMHNMVVPPWADSQMNIMEQGPWTKMLVTYLLQLFK